MKRIVTATFVTCLFSLNMSGCTETNESTTTRETQISTPSGTTTVTTEREVKTTGENPPSVPER